MSDFVEVASTEHVISGTGAWVKPADMAVALFNVGGEMFAIDDACIRCASSLAAGVLYATEIRCRRCGWRYDVATGCVVGMPALRIQTLKRKSWTRRFWLRPRLGRCSRPIRPRRIAFRDADLAVENCGDETNRRA